MEILGSYESTQLVKRQFMRFHRREANTGKAREIATAFTLARGYLESAQLASRIVRPLLVYYAVVSFSKALTLFMSPDLREAGLAQSHGISAGGWGQELSKEGGDVADLPIKINRNGTLGQLINATNHESYLRNNSSIPNYICVHDRPDGGAEITLGDLFARMPEIDKVYSRWRPDRESVPFWPQEETVDGGRKIRVDPPCTEKDIKRVFGSNIDVSKEGSVFSFSVSRDHTIPTLSDTTERWNVGGLVAMNLYPGRLEYSKIATAFIASYALGMLVRYYPSHWVGILNNHRHDAVMPTLLAAMEHIEADFPRLVVDFLERRPSG